MVKRVLVSHSLFDSLLHRDWTQERPSQRSRKWWQLTKRRKQQHHEHMNIHLAQEDPQIISWTKLKEREEQPGTFAYISTFLWFSRVCEMWACVNVCDCDFMRDRKTGNCEETVLEGTLWVMQHVGPHFCYLSAKWKDKALLYLLFRESSWHCTLTVNI